MPYSSLRQLPNYVQAHAQGTQERWMGIFNTSFAQCTAEDGEEEHCEAVAFRNANSILLQHVTANVDGAIREVVRDGKEWLVAPVVMVREGVLNGEFVPGEEIEFAATWNGRPFVLGHPKDKDGHYISANSPGVIELWGLGHVYNAEWAPELRGVRAEVWVDVAKAESYGKLAGQVVQRLRQGEPLEVSTGYWREVVNEAGEWQGQQYDYRQANIRTDHLAALPEGMGACSWQDGCGAPRTQERQPAGMALSVNVLEEARTPDYDGTSSSEWSAPTFEECVAGYWAHNPERTEEEVGSVEDAPAEMRDWIAALSLLGDAQATDFRNLLFYPVVDPGTRTLNESALRAVIGGRSAQAEIPEQANESARRKAYDLLNEEFDADLEYEPLGAEQDAPQDNQEEDMMGEWMAMILEDGRLSEEHLAGLSEEQLEAVYATLQAMPVPESDTEEVQAQEAQEETRQAQEEPQENEALSALLATFEELGGASEVRRLLGNLANSQHEARTMLVNRIAEHPRNRMTQEQLAQMDTAMLKAYRESLEPTDYSGLGLGPVTQSEDDVEEYAMPDVSETA